MKKNVITESIIASIIANSENTMSTVEVGKDSITLDSIASRANVYVHFDVCKGTSKATELTLAGLHKTLPTFESAFRGEWYATETDAIKGVYSALIEYVDTMRNATETDKNALANAEKALAIVKARADAILATLDSFKPCADALVRTLVCGVRGDYDGIMGIVKDFGRVALDELNKVRANVHAGEGFKFGDFKKAYTDMLAKMWRGEYVEEYKFNCNARLAAHMYAMSEDALKIQKGAYIMPTSANERRVVIEFVRAAIWELQNKANA